MSLSGHQSAAMKSDTWLTPPQWIKALGPFDLDPCCPPVMPWPTAAKMLTEAQDGLATPWEGRVWLNPPFGQQAALWLAKMAQHGNGIVTTHRGESMSSLRPECGSSSKPAIPYDTALYLIRDSVAKRKGLIHGRLRDGRGGTCAIGAFFCDNPNAVVHSHLIDEVAAVNDSIPPSATPQERWKKVNGWLRWKLKVLSGAKAGPRP